MALESAFTIPASNPFDANLVFDSNQSVQKARTLYVLGQDPASILSRFEEMLMATGCRFDRGDDTKIAQDFAPPPAVYTTFTFPPLRADEVGFTNTILLYGEERLAASEAVSRFHEGMHAGQWADSAALHANHLNFASAYVLSPREWVRAVLITEAEAYTKAAYLAWAAAEVYGDVSYRTETFFAAVTADEIEAALTEHHGDVATALAELGLKGLEKTHHVQKDGTAVSFAEYYANLALSAYENSVRFNDVQLCREFPFTFVSLDLEDLGRTAADFGPQINSRLAQGIIQQGQSGIITEALNSRLRQLEQKLGLKHVSLPSLGSCLEAEGIGFDAFIARSHQPFARNPADCAYYERFKPV